MDSEEGGISSHLLLPHLTLSHLSLHRLHFLFFLSSSLPEAEKWALRLWFILYPPPRVLNQEQMQQREASWAPCSSSHLECAPLDASQGVGRTTVAGWPTSYSVPQGSGTIIQKMTSRCPMAPPFPKRAMKRCFFTME